jgi:hypothetical protein
MSKLLYRRNTCTRIISISLEVLLVFLIFGYFFFSFWLFALLHFNSFLSQFMSYSVGSSAKNSYVVGAKRVPVGKYEFTVYILDANNGPVVDAGILRL